MSNGRFICLALAAVLVGAGCGKSRTPASEGQAASGGRPTPAQPRLPTVKLWLGTNELTAEVARTTQQLMTGMMFRTEMAEEEGMLFVFETPHRASFWMKNTFVPLSCAFLDSEGVILEIRDLKPKDESPVEAASDRVQFVLEARQGWFERNQVRVGVLVRTERGALADTLIGRR